MVLIIPLAGHSRIFRQQPTAGTERISGYFSASLTTVPCSGGSRVYGQHRQRERWQRSRKSYPSPVAGGCALAPRRYNDAGGIVSHLLLADSVFYWGKDEYLSPALWKEHRSKCSTMIFQKETNCLIGQIVLLVVFHHLR